MMRARPVTLCCARPPPQVFTSKLRERMMRMHTKLPMAPAEVVTRGPNVDAYLKFLVESRQVYETLETVLPVDPRMRRADALNRDIDFLCRRFDVREPLPDPDGPGKAYVDLIASLAAANNAPALECHAYSFYFAHTAGGTMIGKHIHQGLGLTDLETLAFYSWGDDAVADILEDARTALNEAANAWSEDEQMACLEETARAFSHAQELLTLL